MTFINIGKLSDSQKWIQVFSDSKFYSKAYIPSLATDFVSCFS